MLSLLNNNEINSKNNVLSNSNYVKFMSNRGGGYVNYCKPLFDSLIEFIYYYDDS